MTLLKPTIVINPGLGRHANELTLDQAHLIGKVELVLDIGL
jgi:hypothetical protein